MLLACFVVTKELALKHVFEKFAGDGARSNNILRINFAQMGRSMLRPYIFRSAAGAEFERVVGGAGVAVGEGGDAEENLVAGRNVFFTKPVLFVRYRAPQEVDNLRGGERIENVDFGAREQGRDHLERRVFRGRANKRDVARFDVGKKGVLLRLVEAMDFVHEHNGALAGVGLVFGGSHHFLDFLDACKDGAEGDKFRTCEAGDQTRESGFAAARRTPEEHRGDLVIFDLLAKRFAWAEKLFLADKFIKGTRAHALRKRLACGVLCGGWGKLGEKAHGRYEFSIEDVRGPSKVRANMPCPYGRRWRWRAAS